MLSLARAVPILLASCVAAMAQGTVSFSYHPPGVLVPTKAGTGRIQDRKIYLKGITFPIKLTSDQSAYPNSQIYGVGGEFGPAGQCSENYKMPWSDTYCERRSWKMPLCPSGAGHQGDDIRAPACEDDKFEVVAVEDGVITRVTPYPIVYLKGDSGTLFRYLHVNPSSIQVQANQRVSAGAVLARVSDFMEGKEHQTSIHLHFDAQQNLSVNGRVMTVFVPVYTSLIVAYRKAKGLPTLEQPDGTLAVDQSREQ